MHAKRLNLLGTGLLLVSACAGQPYMLYGANPAAREAAYFDPNTNTLTISCRGFRAPRFNIDRNFQGASLYCDDGTTLHALWHVAFAQHLEYVSSFRQQVADHTVLTTQLPGGLLCLPNCQPVPLTSASTTAAPR